MSNIMEKEVDLVIEGNVPFPGFRTARFTVGNVSVTLVAPDVLNAGTEDAENFDFLVENFGQIFRQGMLQALAEDEGGPDAAA